jgi:hypothetical protein
MTFKSSQDALEALLGGHSFLESDDLEDFLRSHQEEDQHLEYKDGKITGRSGRKDGIKEIRRTVSGFANSEGGILILGIDERKPRVVSPCEAVGEEPLDKWIEGLIHDMAPFFSPLPRVYVVRHSLGPIVVVAVARAPVLVPCVEAGRMKYFLRLNQSTLEVPDFLLSDLVLGRRRQPSLQISVRIEKPHPLLTGSCHTVDLHVLVENIGLVAAEHAGVGVVSLVVADAGTEINRHLLSYIDSAETLQLAGFGWALRHAIAKPEKVDARLSPFDKAGFRVKGSLPLLFSATQLRAIMAVYVICQESPPKWFECSFQFGRAPSSDRPYIDVIEVEEIRDRRARVAVEAQN